jgi:hypothetical protein
MSSRYEQILEANGADIPQRWQSFAKRSDPIYGSETMMWGALAHGYKIAADLVAKECCDNGKFRDTLYSPVLFLYRHYIELSLKYLWKEYFLLGLLDSEPPDDDHRLLPLWQRIQEASEAVGLLSADDAFITQVGKSILLFDRLDKRSTHSRYPTVGGKYSSLYVNIEALIRAVDDIDTIFYGLGAMIQEWEPV